MNIQRQLTVLDLHPEIENVTQEVCAGLAKQNKSLSPKYFYDERGSQLFEAITQLDEYYPTRTELGLFDAHLSEIADLIGEGSCVIEYGSGSSLKIRKLFEALSPLAYVPVDISRDYLLSNAMALAQDFPRLTVLPVCADFSQPIALPEQVDGMNPIAFFPGSSIGNFEPAQAKQFLRRVADTLGCGGHLLIGVDCKKDRVVLERAYNDAAGITAAFNLNALSHLNRLLGTKFQLDAFEHEAHYNEDAGCIQMFLRSTMQQQVSVGGSVFTFDDGERLHTENSYKYSPNEFVRLAEDSAFRCEHYWQDADEYFALYLLKAC